MEKILDVYSEPYDELHPLICMDEASKQITSDVEPALPMSPGQPRREDHHYQRKDVRAVFIFFDPLRGWRRVASCESRTRVDWAEQVRRLLTRDYPKAKRVTLVCDNLNTHDIASLYTAFDAPTAHALAQRLRIEHTPRNGSWLNMAEIELSVLTRQCIGRRFDHPEQMAQAMKRWQRDRNRLRCPATWRFTTSDARIKLQSLYPEPYI
jgi:hypothetical protein